MTATTLDLRYRTHNLIAALARGVEVIITYRGRKTGVLSPYTKKTDSPHMDRRVCDHPYFGSAVQTTRSVEHEMDFLRGRTVRRRHA